MAQMFDTEFTGPVWFSNCPEHGGRSKRVVREYASKGSDPYNIEVLDCGHHVMDLGDGPIVVKFSSRLF